MVTKLGLAGYGVNGLAIAVPPSSGRDFIGVLTRLGSSGYGARLTGSFEGRSSNAAFLLVTESGDTLLAEISLGEVSGFVADITEGPDTLSSFIEVDSTWLGDVSLVEGAWNGELSASTSWVPESGASPAWIEETTLD